MKPLRVLSIDWDYLVNATMEERLYMFPDGGNENLPTGILDYIWASRYAENPKLAEIAVDEPDMENLKQFILKSCNNRTRIIIADSHKHIFDSVSKAHKKAQPVTIINVDFHHDCYGENNSSVVDCGNWVTQLFVNKENRLNMDLSQSKYYWVKRDDSDDLEKSYEWCHTISIDDMKSLEEFPFDLLFICRSGVWSPPHLDNEFLKLCNWCRAHITSLIGIKDNYVLLNRYNKHLQGVIEQIKANMESVNQFNQRLQTKTKLNSK